MFRLSFVREATITIIDDADIIPPTANATNMSGPYAPLYPVSNIQYILIMAMTIANQNPTERFRR